MRAYSSLLHGRVAALALVCASTLLGLVAIEIGYRIHSDRPAFVLGNWRAWRIEHYTFGDRGMFDPLLGWTMQEGYVSNGYNTLDHGIRRNFRESAIRSGAILAVGGLFTDGGNHVADLETWPAQLEGIAGMPVLNAGVEGYATDQIVLRAEQLLPLVGPKAMILGFVGEEISNAGHRSSFGAPKPYFSLEKGELKYHPPRPIVVDGQSLPAWQATTREILGYSAIFDVVLNRIAPNYWYGRGAQPVIQRVDNDPVGVTCALLQRLKKRADADAIPLLLFMQHALPAIVEREEPSEDARKVAACAATTGIEVIDQFAGLRAIGGASREALQNLYTKGDGHGPMSPKGNRHAAELLARALTKQR